MIKRTVEISRDRAHLCVQHAQLHIRREGEVVGSIPCEDLGVIIVDHPQVSYSHAALIALAEADSVLVVCGHDHLPVAVMLPLADHSQVVWRLNEQLSVSRPLRKKLWQQIVRAKIVAQANCLTSSTSARGKLLALARQVRSGDRGNIEAQAARVYWQCFLPDEVFRRDADADGLNALLNYGYSILRAAVARAIVAAGLLPSLGLHHSNRGNLFCLADDLMEPMRPLIDDRARELFRQGYDSIETESKASLLKVLAEDVQVLGESGPLMVCLHRYVSSLVKCFQGVAKRLEIPVAVKQANGEKSTECGLSDAN